ncbi:hypothetical protein PQX77_008889 [Marasmius sp. AFHP31]|nr:hypothetical protein PQX77_008889 [Marasmius sp. AFHP31]
MPPRQSRKSVQQRTAVAQSGKWTEEEDERLLMGIQQYGDELVALVVNIFQERSHKDCLPSRYGRVWSPEEDIGLNRGYNNHGPKWPLISKLYVRSRSAEGDLAVQKPLALDVSFKEADIRMLGELGLAIPLPTETLMTFRKREAENLVTLAHRLEEMQKSQALGKESISRQVEEHARRLDELHGTWNSEQKAVLERIEKHTHMFHDGFSQLKGIQQALSMLSRQPVPDPDAGTVPLVPALNPSRNRKVVAMPGLKPLRNPKT